MRRIAPVTIDSDSDPENNSQEKEVETQLLVDWRGTIVSAAACSSGVESSVDYVSKIFKRKSSTERPTSGKKPEHAKAVAEPDVVVLDRTPSKSETQKNIAGNSDGFDPICLDSDNETNDGTKDMMLLDNTDVHAFHTSQIKLDTNGNFYNFAEPTMSGNSEKEEQLESSQIVTQTANTIQFKEKFNTVPMENIGSDFLETDDITGDIGCSQDTNLRMEGSAVVTTFSEEQLEGAHREGTKTQLSKDKDKEMDKITKEEKRKRRQEEIVRRKKEKEEEKLRRKEEQRLKREEEKLRKASMKAEAAELKKKQKEIQKFGKGKYAKDAISTEIDARLIEKGLIGGRLVNQLAEKGFCFHIVLHQLPFCILWKMSMPEQNCLSNFIQHEVLYVAFVLEAEEFCNMVSEGSLDHHIYNAQRCHPGHTICYIINKLDSYIHKRNQEKYRNLDVESSWNDPPVEQALARLSTHFVGVRSRLCLDESEVADHIARLTRSLSESHFRKKLSHLSIRAEGTFLSKNPATKEILKESVWLKMLMSVPKLPPHSALAIAKNYPNMRSLLDVYLDPEKSVIEKEFLLQNLVTEGPLGDGDRRLGPVCSKRVYRILMAQSGNLKTDDVEDGASMFESV